MRFAPPAGWRVASPSLTANRTLTAAGRLERPRVWMWLARRRGRRRGVLAVGLRLESGAETGQLLGSHPAPGLLCV